MISDQLGFATVKHPVPRTQNSTQGKPLTCMNDYTLPVQNELQRQPIVEFKLNDFHYRVSDQQLLNDLKQVAAKLGRINLTMAQYAKAGKFNPGTLKKRFGSWNKALLKAGLQTGLTQRIPEKDLFENIKKVWIHLGRQPSLTEMCRPLSRYSTHPYVNRFGSWRKALLAFISYINSPDNGQYATGKADERTPVIKNENEIVFKHQTKRNPGERLKVQVLMRDGNRCSLCGVTLTGGDIHFDHIIPWSKGGETILENLQVLCKKHNLAKGGL